MMYQQRRISYILLFLLVGFSLLGQDGFNPKEQIRARSCQRIFNELKLAKGINPNEKPVLEMVVSLDPNQYKIALVNNLGIVQFDRASMNLCYSMGKDSLNALSFILSHELAHFIHQHSEVNKFIEDQVGIESQGAVLRGRFTISTSDSITSAIQFNETLQNLKIRENEAIADLDAGFTSYLAGYQTKHVGSAFFEKAYERFNINNQSNKYVNLQDRKKIMDYAGFKLDTLIHVFEVANYLSLIHEFDLAQRCYQYVAESYNNKVILNNLGVLQLRKFISLTDKDFHTYALPITMDIDFTGGSRGIDDVEKEYRMYQDMILDAIQYFEQASEQSNRYAIAELNTSIAYFLLFKLKNKYANYANFADDDLIFAQSAALKAKQLTIDQLHQQDKTTLSHAFNMLAIIAFEANHDKENAKQLLQNGLDIYPNNSVILKNQAIILSNAALFDSSVVATESNVCLQPEKFKEETITQFFKKPEPITDFQLDIGDPSNQSFGYILTVKEDAEKRTYNVYKILMYNGQFKQVQERVGFLIPSQMNDSTACQISTESSSQDLLQNYGSSVDSIQLNSGKWVYYKDKNQMYRDFQLNDGIIFQLEVNSNAQENSERVSAWVFYQKQKRIERE